NALAEALARRAGKARETAGSWKFAGCPRHLVPPAGFEPALPAPEADALSPELRGLGNDEGIATFGEESYRVPDGTADRWVSYIRTGTTAPEAAVTAATAHTAARTLTASAITPASRAPTAKPPSRHRR